MDERFSFITRDHRFRPIKQAQRKVQIDKRFQGIFFNKRFQENFTVDKRGRPLQETNAKNLRKYYHLSNKERRRILKERRLEKQKKAELLDSQESGKNGTVQDVTDGEEPSHEKGNEFEQDENSDTDSGSDFVSSDDDEIDLARGKGNVESSSEEEDFEFEEDVNDVPDHKWGEMDNDAPRSEETSHRLALCGMDWDRISATDIFVILQSYKPAQGSIKSVSVYPSEYGIARMAEEDRSGPAELRDMRSDENTHEWSKEDDDNFNTEKLREYQLNRLKYYYAVIVCDSIATAENIYNKCDGSELANSFVQLDLRFIPDGMEFTDHPPKQHVTSMPDLLTYKEPLFTSQTVNSTNVKLTWDETDHKRIAVTKSRVSKEELENLDFKDFLASGSESDNDNVPEIDLGDISSKMDDKERAEMYRKLLLDECVKSDEEDVDMEITWEPDLKTPADGSQTVKNSKKQSDADEHIVDDQQASKAELEMIMLSDDRMENETNFQLNVDDERFSAMYTSSKYAIDQSSALYKKSDDMKKILNESQVRLKRKQGMDHHPKSMVKESKIASDSISNLVKSVKQKARNFSKKSKFVK